MADTAQIVYHHSDGNTIDFFTKNANIEWKFPGKTISRQPNKVGLTDDPNQVYRVVTCNANLTGDTLNTFNGYLMPATAPTYDGSYPKIVLYLDGDTTFTILCAVTMIVAVDLGAGKWNVGVTFTERSL